MLIKNIQKILLLIGCILLLISIYYCNKYVNINNTIENFNDITVETPSYTHTPPILTPPILTPLTPTPTYTIPSITLDSYTSITNPNMSSMPSSMSSMPGSMSSMPDSMSSMPDSMPDSMLSNLTYSNPTASNNLYISPINNTELYNPDNKLVMS